MLLFDPFCWPYFRVKIFYILLLFCLLTFAIISIILSSASKVFKNFARCKRKTKWNKRGNYSTSTRFIDGGVRRGNFTFAWFTCHLFLYERNIWKFLLHILRKTYIFFFIYFVLSCVILK